MGEGGWDCELHEGICSLDTVGADEGGYFRGSPFRRSLVDLFRQQASDNFTTEDHHTRILTPEG